MDQLKTEYEELKRQNASIDELQKRVNVLGFKMLKLPSLRQKKQVLRARIEKYNEYARYLADKEGEINRKEQEAIKREAILSDKVKKLQKQLGWLELASLREEIETTKKELAELNRQLGEKRSILDRILGRNKGVSP